MSGKRLRVADFSHLVDTMLHRLTPWKAFHLSSGTSYVNQLRAYGDSSLCYAQHLDSQFDSLGHREDLS